MLAAQEAGCTLDEFLDLDGLEYQAWVDYALSGPSRFRSQLLTAQLLQMVSAFVSKKASPIDTLLPYYNELTGADTPRARAQRAERHRAVHQGMVEDLLVKGAQADG